MTSTDIALPSDNAMGAFSPEDENIVRYLGLDPRNAAHRAQVAICRHYSFDPVLKHVVVIPKGGVYITRDGLLHVAHRSGQLDGIVVEQEPTLSEDGKEWVARVSVYRKDMGHPFTFPGRYPVAGMNRDYAQEMSLKAAEAHALRRAFDVSGLPTLDEQRPEPARSTGGLGAVLAPEEPVDGEVVDESTLLDTRGPLARKMHALFREAELEDKADRLAYASAIVGREVTTSAELTDAEAEAVVKALEAIAADVKQAGAGS